MNIDDLAPGMDVWARDGERWILGNVVRTQDPGPVPDSPERTVLVNIDYWALDVPRWWWRPEDVKPVTYSWDQPKCEHCWIDAEGTWEGQRLISVKQPTRMVEPELERCAWCGNPTIFGVYVRENPSLVSYPAKEPLE